MVAFETDDFSNFQDPEFLRICGFMIVTPFIQPQMINKVRSFVLSYIYPILGFFYSDITKIFINEYTMDDASFSEGRPVSPSEDTEHKNEIAEKEEGLVALGFQFHFKELKVIHSDEVFEMFTKMDHYACIAVTRFAWANEDQLLYTFFRFYELPLTIFEQKIWVLTEDCFFDFYFIAP